jgi:glyoxylase-like metal-dependent hydrolase (beta-lactamase superfamily II)
VEVLEERRIGCATVLFGAEAGKYPDANSLLVEGGEETVLIDPALGVVARGAEALPQVDRVLLSHCHEDHLPGLFLFPEASCHLHQEDLPGIRSLEAMLAIYGLDEPQKSQFERLIVERFHFQPRPDAVAFQNGDVFDLGGGVRIRVQHAPGHTRGHCVFVVEPLDLVYLGDVDLSGFGPYYGDAWSSLEDFERTLREVRQLDAHAYLSSHHIGLLEGREAFLHRLTRYEAKIRDREERLLEYLQEPRTMDEIVAHRFVYRPQDKVAADPVERHMMGQHLARLLRQGAVREMDGSRFQRVV